jgi:hypothetical protein
MVFDPVQGCVRGRAERPIPEELLHGPANTHEGTANSRQVGGDHYRAVPGEQHWDRVARLGLDYWQAMITRYVERWRLKGGVEDLKKARHFLDKYLELIEAGTVPGPDKKEDE